MAMLIRRSATYLDNVENPESAERSKNTASDTGLLTHPEPAHDTDKPLEQDPKDAPKE